VFLNLWAIAQLEWAHGVKTKYVRIELSRDISSLHY